MITRFFIWMFPGIDWDYFFLRLRSLRLPRVLIRDFSLVEFVTRVYFLFEWHAITHQWGGWALHRIGSVSDYRIRIDKIVIYIQFIDSVRTRTGVATRRRASVRCLDARTDAPVGPRFDFRVSLSNYLHVLQWVDLYNQTHK